MKLVDICKKKMELKGFVGLKKYEKRLRWELEEINAKEREDYFLNIYNKGIKYPSNENNLLICYLLGIVPDFDIDKDPACSFGESPDIDIDYVTVVKEYLKSKWIPEAFGSEYVCNIGTYSAFGLKSSLIDMARVHGESREEVQAVTKKLQVKDDEGKPLSWDSAIRLYPELKGYCEKYPEVANAARKLLNRNRGTGVHPAGIIISSKPLSDFVPLMKRRDGPQVSAWTEGLSGQDLQPIGLIKFDLLVIDNLLQIARCCDLVKRRHNKDGICNLKDLPDWSDVDKWRNDAVALAMASTGDLKGVFQFGSEGIRALVRSSGVDRFEDLVALSSLYRPGPLNAGMATRYVERKRGRESYALHPLLAPILEKTYGVLCYQEQVMKILNVAGEIPLKDCEALRKAISKKKEHVFAKYKIQFIINGQKNLSYTEKEINHLWDQIVAFAEYGFCLSHAVAYTYVSSMLLYLKAHYPEEFYAAILSCETLSSMIKDYKMEAKIHGVETERLHINKSKVNFDLQEKSIYFGFSNVKGLGEAPAKRIVEGQPYKNFEDFLNKFGTDANVLKPLIGLRCFKDRDPVTLWKFTEYYKDKYDKIYGKKKRLADAFLKYEKTFKELAPDASVTLAELKGEDPFASEEWKSAYNKEFEIIAYKEVECKEEDEGSYPRSVVKEIAKLDDDDLDLDLDIEEEEVKYYKKEIVMKKYNVWKELNKLWKKRVKSIEKELSVESFDLPKLAEFDPNEVEIDDKFLKELRDPEICEKKYYGFSWIHDLENSPDYHGNLTFDALRNEPESIGPVEIKVVKVAKTKSKNGRDYWQVTGEDVTGQENKFNMWPNDWDRFSLDFGYKEQDGEAIFKEGNLLRVRLVSPTGNWPFWLESNQSGKWNSKTKFADKKEDPRVIVMQFGEKEEEKFLTDEEALSLFESSILG